MRRIGVLVACLAVALFGVAIYQGYQGTLRDLDMLSDYDITQEVTPPRLDYHCIPHLLQAIHAFKQTHSGREPSHILIRSSGRIDIERRTPHSASKLPSSIAASFSALSRKARGGVRRPLRTLEKRSRTTLTHTHCAA